jgi:aspartate-semialdehyde dehydrogenase
LDFGCDFLIGVCGNISVRWVMNGFIFFFFQVKRMVVSTYQAASGAGAAAMRELELQTHEVSFIFSFSMSWLLILVSSFKFN